MMKHTQHLAAGLAAALAAALLLAGCGSSNTFTSSDTSAAGAFKEAVMSYDSAVNAETGGVESSLTPQENTSEKIIYNASVSMESTDFDGAVETLMAAVEANSAYLEHTSQSGSADDGSRYAYYTVRVPVANYRAFLAAVGEAGNVLNLSESADNITSSYIDVQARLTALEAQRDRLNALADQAETTADLLEIESQLSDVQYQIESYTQQLRYMDDQVDYSTVDIDLDEVATLTPVGTTFVEKLADAFRGGWSGFVAFVQGLILLLVALWPVLLIAAAVVAVLFLTRPARKARKAQREAKRKAALPAQAPAYPGPNAAPKATPDAPQPETPDQPSGPKYQ